MEKRALVILGSPRKKGNSALLAGEIVKGVKAAGASVESVWLHGLKIAPCNSCYACQKERSRGCAIHDDMQDIYGKLLDANAWVIASPVYWFTMSAQTKLFMDRLFALPAYSKNPFAGRRVAIAMTYGGEDPFDSGGVNAFRTFQDAFGYVGATIVGYVHGSAMGAGEILSQKKKLKEAFALGKKLVAG